MGKRSAFLREVFGASAKGELDYHGKAADCFVVPDSFAFTGDFLTLGEKCLWLAILWQCQKRNPNTRICWPSRETLGVMIGVSPRQVTRLIKGLVTKGVLYVRQRANDTPYYLLKDVPENKMNRTKERLPKPVPVTFIQKRAVPKPTPVRIEEAPVKTSNVLKCPLPLDKTKNVHPCL